ncbi:MAG: hypothetical protein CSA74_08485 [Rhodobacterales bacterium]|nr:MAG: hypothetical protein CSA74_08485 [Rhodobacterales bacterium]
MIRFTLQCPGGHRFESWFRDGQAFDTVAAAGGLVCPDCGSTEIEKSLMTPRIRPARDRAQPPAPVHAQASAPMSGPAALAHPPAGAPAPPLAAASPREKAIAALRARVESEADYVGLEFAREARAMHTGDVPQRPIYGEAKAAEAVELIEEGIPVAPLPFTPTRKVN